MDTHSKSDAASIRRDSLPLEEEKEQESTSPVAEEPNEKPQQSSPLQDQYEYVTGFKLVIVIVAITLVAFLMMLDMSIIVTVSIFNREKLGLRDTDTFSGYPSDHQRLSFPDRRGLVWQCLPTGQVNLLLYPQRPEY